MKTEVKPQYNPKSDILSTIFCDILGDNCPDPELLCRNCPVLQAHLGTTG